VGDHTTPSVARHGRAFVHCSCDRCIRGVHLPEPRPCVVVMAHIPDGRALVTSAEEASNYLVGYPLREIERHFRDGSYQLGVWLIQHPEVDDG
jgi:hypothetical protein